MNLNNQKVSMTKPTINQTSVSKTPTRSVGSLSNYGSSRPASLTVGQVIKGEVTDLRNNEVSVVLENNTKVTGSIENSSSLSIGQPAAFKVTQISSEGITLEALPNSYSSSEKITIKKALEEANLPLTDKNQAIVHELLKNQLSINKQSIQSILQQSYHFKDISISTLVLMNKYKIPLTQENALQFEHYRNYEHRLANEITNLADAVPNLMEHLAEGNASQAVCNFGNRLLTYLLKESSLTEKPADPLLSFSSSQEREELIQILSEFPLGEEEQKQLQSNSITLRDTVKMIDQCHSMALEVDLKKMEEALLSLDDAIDTEKNPELLSLEAFQIPSSAERLNSPVIQSVLDTFHGFQAEQNELSSFLTQEDREQLLDQVKEIPISPQLREKIQSGETTAKEVLNIIKNFIPLTDPDKIKHVFQGQAFQSLIKEHMKASFCLTPKNFQKQPSIKEYYQSIYQKLNDLESLMQTNLSGSESSMIAARSEQMRQNIDFMQTLNHIFPYVQLPVRLKNKQIHSELYVYTKRRNLLQNPENISVLLHLDMDYLGPLDIHITLNKNHVFAKFYAENDESKELLSYNMERLEDALNKKGFVFSGEFLQRTHSVDLVEDFMAPNIGASNTSMKRFTFDIRA